MEAGKFFAIFIPIFATIIVTLGIILTQKSVLTRRQKRGSIALFITGIIVLAIALILR